MNSPKVSVLIPTYNYARFIGEAIESVLSQDFRDFELLIVDDCSTDNTADVVQPFCARDERVHFIVNSPNLGMVKNWNHCLELARGHYVKFLFGDDKLCHPQALSKMVEMLERNPSATLAASARAILDENSVTVEHWRTLKNGFHTGHQTILACLAQDKNLIGEPSAVLFRKRDASRGFDPRFRQIVDLEMWFHLLKSGDFVYTREPLCGFRQHSQQQTNVNRNAGVALKEHADFFVYHVLNYPVPQKLIFIHLYALRRAIRKHPDKVTPDIIEREKRLAEKIDRSSYVLYWLQNRISQPFVRLARSLKKRFNRMQVALQRGRAPAGY